MSSSSESCLTVVEVSENRYDDAIHHLKWNFFADEPLNNAVGLCAKGESQCELERHCLLTLKQGYSRMLVDKKGTVSNVASYRKIRAHHFLLIMPLLSIVENSLFFFFVLDISISIIFDHFYQYFYSFMLRVTNISL